ncbi:MAG: SDR family oxidoreductase [Thermoleophilia bacterium]|nr:SDR family oxidoreductase [Thermoleophilia bacterium]
MRLDGKTALVTGGGTGIGAAIAERLVAEGAKVCITGRRKERLEQEAAGLGTESVLACPGDVANSDDVKRMVASTVAFGGSIDILVNNAAYDVYGVITELDPEEWQRVMDVNLKAPFMLMKESLPHMIENGGGSIINIASIGGIRCMAGSPAYGTSKAGLIHLTKAVALDYGPFGVRCNVVCPGATRTEMFEDTVGKIAQAKGTDVETLLKGFAAPVPLRRVSTPSEMAGVCAFLAGEDSSFMTGAVLVVDGGAIIVDVAGVADD